MNSTRLTQTNKHTYVPTNTWEALVQVKAEAMPNKQKPVMKVKKKSLLTQLRGSPQRKRHETNSLELSIETQTSRQTGETQTAQAMSGKKKVGASHVRKNPRRQTRVPTHPASWETLAKAYA